MPAMDVGASVLPLTSHRLLPCGDERRLLGLSGWEREAGPSHLETSTTSHPRRPIQPHRRWHRLFAATRRLHGMKGRRSHGTCVDLVDSGAVECQTVCGMRRRTAGHVPSAISFRSNLSVLLVWQVARELDLWPVDT